MSVHFSTAPISSERSNEEIVRSCNISLSAATNAVVFAEVTAPSVAIGQTTQIIVVTASLATSHIQSVRYYSTAVQFAADFPSASALLIPSEHPQCTFFVENSSSSVDTGAHACVLVLDSLMSDHEHIAEIPVSATGDSNSDASDVVLHPAAKAKAQDLVSATGSPSTKKRRLFDSAFSHPSGSGALDRLCISSAAAPVDAGSASMEDLLSYLRGLFCRADAPNVLQMGKMGKSVATRASVPLCYRWDSLAGDSVWRLTASATGRPAAAAADAAAMSDTRAGAAHSIGGGGPGATAGPAHCRVAGFDMDGTLTVTKSGNVFAKDATDWQFIRGGGPAIRQGLAALHAGGWRVVMFTNQAKAKTAAGSTPSTSAVAERVLDVVKQLGIPMEAYVSVDGSSRKPRATMWRLCEEEGLATWGSLSKADSFYCGDAASRPDGWKSAVGYPADPLGTKPATGKASKSFLARIDKADHSDADIGFALNVGVPFFVPEQLFCSRAVALPSWSTSQALSFDPRKLRPGVDGEFQRYPSEVASAIAPSEKPEVILLVARPASGKSTFAKSFFEQRTHFVDISGMVHLSQQHGDMPKRPNGSRAPPTVRVNRDELKTQDRCLASARSALAKGSSVIVDNTNPSISHRAPYITLAKEFGVPVRCFVIETSSRLSSHLNKYRAISTREKAAVDPTVVPVDELPGMALRMYTSRFEKPTVSEGLSAVITVPFVVLPSVVSADDSTSTALCQFL